VLSEWYFEYKNFVDNAVKSYLENYLNKNITNPWLQRFKEIVFYSTKWWKRIRAILALEMYLILTKKTLNDLTINSSIIKFIIAIELLHSYSLVHDDLPCMDNDELRRWEPTVWKKYSEYEAVLVWDLLNTLSFEVLSEISDFELWIKLIKILSSNTWYYWMVGGQVDDMFFEKNIDKLSIDDLIKLHNKKTWALIKTAIIWWILCSKSNFWLKKYEDLSEKLWLAFQIKDDLLDFEWTMEETGKSVWWEEKGFVYFLGVKKTKEYLEQLIKDCLEIIKDLNSKKLEFLINYIKERKK